MSYWHIPSHLSQPVLARFTTDLQAAHKQLDWISELGGKPVRSSAFGQTNITAIAFEGEVPKGFRQAGSLQDRPIYKPDKRNKAGKAWQEKLDQCRKIPDLRKYLEDIGVPVTLCRKSVSMWTTPAIYPLQDDSVLLNIEDDVTSFTPRPEWRELKASEYHQLIEKDEAETQAASA